MRTASLTADGVAGRAIFQAQGCAQCHGGRNFTESGAATLRDVGTIRSPAAAIDSVGPSPGSTRRPCVGSGRRAPYLHDGSAATLEEAVRAHDGVTHQRRRI